MKRPISTMRLLGILLIASVLLNVYMVFALAWTAAQLNNYAEECGDRSDAPQWQH